MKKNGKQYLGWGLSLLIILFSVGCVASLTVPNKETPTSFPTVRIITPTKIATESHVINFDGLSFPDNVNPLTGEVVGDTTLLDRRPIAVKVSNDPRPMRPQWGLSLADIVFEYYTEWGKTRFLALYYGNNANQVGPIRSARFFDENIVLMYKAALAYVGADDRVLRRFEKAEYAGRLISEWPAGCPPICRIDVKMWNHAMTNTGVFSDHLMSSGIGNDRQDLRGMAFASQQPSGGDDGLILFFRYSPYTYSQWVYDHIHRDYVRLSDYQDDDHGQGEEYEVMNDRLTGEVITAQNVVVIYVEYSYVVKKDDVEVVNMNLMGTGKAELFRDGKKYDVYWQRVNKETLLRLVDKSGQPFPFKPGKTWFEVIGVTSQITHQEAGIYRYTFSIP